MLPLVRYLLNTTHTFDIQRQFFALCVFEKFNICTPPVLNRSELVPQLVSDNVRFVSIAESIPSSATRKTSNLRSVQKTDEAQTFGFAALLLVFVKTN